MNVLFISSLYPVDDDNNTGFVTHALHKLVKTWNKDTNAQVQVVCPVYRYLRESFNGKMEERSTEKKKTISIDDVPVTVFPIVKIPKIAYYYRSLYRFLDKYLPSIGFKPDVVTAHYDKSLHIGYRYARRLNVPLIAGIHITPDLMTGDPTAFTKRCGEILQYASAIACRSNYIYKKIAQWFPQHKEKCFIAFSGIEEDIIREPEYAAQRLKQWKKGTGTVSPVSIITVAALMERKKIDTVLKALAPLKNKFDWNYTIIGDGEERRRLETMASELGISERVRFKGTQPRQRVIEELKRSHIFVLVSYMETFGLSYLEAMATGNIVIGGRDEGIDGVVEQGKNGFLSPVGDVEALENTLERIVFELTDNRLEQILADGYRTITAYTDKNAASNYWKRLEAVANVVNENVENANVVNVNVEKGKKE